jgi:hypothetical protein
MASVNFLYRSTKDSANLNLRLLYRYNDEDFVHGVKTKLEIEYNNWYGHHAELKGNKKKGSKEIKIKKTNDVDVLNRRLEVNTEINKIENHVIQAFNSVNPDEVNKEWLQTQIDYYYNPPKQAESIPTNLIKYIDYYIEYRQHEITKTSERKFNVIKHKLERFEKYRKKALMINDINESFKNEFVKFQKKELYSQNTMQRELVFIKTRSFFRT